MAKRYIDKSIEEQQAERADAFSKRMQNLKSGSLQTFDNLSRMATGLAKEEVFGIPGLLGDLAEPAAAIMNPVLLGSNPEIRENLSEFQKDFGAVGLAKAAGVELSDDFLDDEGELRPEMVGRLLAPGALYVKGASLLPELSTGVQALVRGLKDDGFFPAGGPQPATVSGPSPMTQGPADAGPRSNVFMSEAQGTPTGGERSLVQAEKEDRFVSPDNPAVIEQGPPETTTGASISGVSETGVYLPVRAALMNIDIPAGGIAANKLLEKLRGQPRAGSELKATGFADFLKMKGDAKITKDEIDRVYDGMSPAPVIRTVMNEPFRYAGKDVEGTSIGYAGMQRQIGASDTEVNGGVILFGDEKNKVGGKPTQTVSGHRYFERHLPTTYGHVRFSIQEMLDPVTNKPIKALLVEEIQSDLVRAFSASDRARKKVRSIDQIKKDLVEQDPGMYAGMPDESLTNIAVANQKTESFDADRLLDGKAVYGPGEKLADATLDIHPDVVKYQGMQEKVSLAENGDKILTDPAMIKIENRLDIGLADETLDYAAELDISKFILTNNLHTAKTEAEARDILTKMNARGVDLPKPRRRSRQQEEANLNAQEIAAERINAVVEQITRFRERSIKELKREKANPDGSGIMSAVQKLTDLMKSKITEDDLVRRTRDEITASFAFTARGVASDKAALRIHNKNKDKLFEARQKDLEDNKTTETTSFAFMDPSGTSDQAVRVRDRLSKDEILQAINKEDLEAEVDDVARLFMTDMQILNDADPVFRGVANRYDDFGRLKNYVREDILDKLGKPATNRYTAAERNKEVTLNRIAEAKESAPTPKEMVAQIDKILSDEQGVGELFRRRYNLDNDVDAVGIAANPQMLSESMLDAGDYISRPPFETQNDFTQFAMRAIASEAKKLEVDAVIVPSVEEMITARATHGTVNPARAIEQTEAFKTGLAQEKKIRGAIQKVSGGNIKRMDRDRVLTDSEIKELQELGTTAFEDLGYGVPKTAGEAVDALNSLTIDMGGGNIKMLRGHFQNYGDSLDAALSTLKKDGFDITELDTFNVRQAVRSDGYTPLGEYAKKGKPELAKYRMIDLREGKKGADVAKKVPSLYNKGGHVDVRGGIGAMARSVM